MFGFQGFKVLPILIWAIPQTLVCFCFFSLRSQSNIAYIHMHMYVYIYINIWIYIILYIIYMIRSGDPYRPRRSYMARWVFTGHCSHVISQRRLEVHFSRETNACPPPKRSGLLANTPETSLYFTSHLLHGYGSIPINTIFRGMNIHLPAILMFTRGTRFWHTATFRWFTDDFHGFPDPRGVFSSAVQISARRDRLKTALSVPAAGTSARTMAGLVR